MKKMMFLLLLVWSLLPLLLFAQNNQSASSPVNVDSLLDQAVHLSQHGDFAQSNQLLETLFYSESDTVNDELIGEVFNLMLTNDRLSGQYAAAATLMQLMAESRTNDELYQQVMNYYTVLGDQPSAYMTRPNHDVSVPFMLQLVGNGTLMRVMVVIDGKTEPFILDCGCGEMCFASEVFAMEHHIRPVGLSVLIDSAGGKEQGWIGITDSIQLGEIVFHNLLFTVTPMNANNQSIQTVNAVLGANIFRMLGDVEIHGPQHKLIFPEKQRQIASNIIVKSNGQCYLPVKAGGEHLFIHLNSGNSRSSMGVNYFRRHQAEVLKQGTLHQGKTGGYRGIDVADSYLLPTLSFQFANGTFHLDQLLVDTQQGPQPLDEDGSFGNDMMRAFTTFTINLQKMYVVIEP